MGCRSRSVRVPRRPSRGRVRADLRMTVDTTAPATTRRATRSRANRFDWTGGVVSDALLSIAVALWGLAVSGVRGEAMGDLGLRSALLVTVFGRLSVVV